MELATSNGDQKVALSAALVKYVKSAVLSATAGNDYGIEPVTLSRLTNRDVFAVSNAVLAQHSLKFESRVPDFMKKLIFEAVCRCFPALRRATETPKTFFCWITNRSCVCYVRDRKTGSINERGMED